MAEAQSSITVQLNPGTYYLCACGRSKNTPFCDGTHQGSSFQPIALELDMPKVVEVTGSMQPELRS
jgi:CDGSH-type Zn-finger protein